MLSSLEASRFRFGPGEAGRVLNRVRRAAVARYPDADSLLRFHEALLFLRAFPQAPAVVPAVERALQTVHIKVEALRRNGAEMAAFDTFEYSGVAGTEMEDTLSFDVARWLIRRLPGKIEVAWKNYEPGRELGNTVPRFVPFLEDDAFVEADTPWRQWLEAAGGKRSNGKPASPAWLMERFESLSMPELRKAELYDSLRMPLRWSLGNSPLTRTLQRVPARKVFYHGEPLIGRKRVVLASELARRPPALKRLSRSKGQQIVESVREAMLVRYRELYGTSLADPNSVMQAEPGRGVTIYLWNLPPERRLPLRAYVAGMTLKNGVPVNYIEAIGLFEWMEVGFNTFYTFRGGEAGWIYAQVLRCLCQRMGTSCISVYPYQLGHDNDEAIQSGAFWFYYKLGFRPGRADLRKLAEGEEEKIAADPHYRTPARTLRRLAAGHVFYELAGDARRGRMADTWNRFSTRELGLGVNRRMARDFQGDAVKMREHARRKLEKVLGATTDSWKLMEKGSFDNFALLLADIPEVRWWTRAEKDGLLAVIRSKSQPDEMAYLRNTQKHGRLRDVLLKRGDPGKA